MANCHHCFLKFNSAIELKKTRKETLRTSRNAVREKIRKYFRDKQKGFYPRFHGQGSFMMNTIILPLDGEFDIDDGIYFRVDQKPQQTPDTFHRWICEALDGQTDESPIDKMTCVRVVYAGDYHIDLPIYYIVGNNCPKLAHKRDGWIDSDPREFIDWFQANTDNKGQLRRIIRYFKAWRDFKPGKLPSGLILSILATNNFYDDSRDDIALYETLLNIQRSLILSFTCYRPTTPKYEDLLQKYSPSDKEYFWSQLNSLIKSAEYALDHQTKQKDACKAWQKHFGARFLCEIEDNKNDGLFSEPYKPSLLTFPNQPVIPNKPKGFA
ncbi:hypothetical protein H6G04_29270 [Calothrix membranacea FACHB-236]|nr:hypothetical protein [Calothrix membranacea FACHB-236]